MNDESIDLAKLDKIQVNIGFLSVVLTMKFYYF